MAWKINRYCRLIANCYTAAEQRQQWPSIEFIDTMIFSLLNAMHFPISRVSSFGEFFLFDSHIHSLASFRYLLIIKSNQNLLTTSCEHMCCYLCSAPLKNPIRHKPSHVINFDIFFLLTSRNNRFIFHPIIDGFRECLRLTFESNFLSYGTSYELIHYHEHWRN